MNRLRELRLENGLTTIELEKYTGLIRSTISMLENEKRKFRQTHIDLLTSFFNVSSDYLLGKTDVGISVFSKDTGNSTEVSLSDYISLKPKLEITIVKRDVDMIGFGFDFSPYFIYREFVGEEDNKNMDLKTKLTSLADRMTKKELEKAIKFIEEYIL